MLLPVYLMRLFGAFFFICQRDCMFTCVFNEHDGRLLPPVRMLACNAIRDWREAKASFFSFLFLFLFAFTSFSIFLFVPLCSFCQCTYSPLRHFFFFFFFSYCLSFLMTWSLFPLFTGPSFSSLTLPLSLISLRSLEWPTVYARASFYLFTKISRYTGRDTLSHKISKE